MENYGEEVELACHNILLEDVPVDGGVLEDVIL